MLALKIDDKFEFALLRLLKQEQFSSKPFIEKLRSQIW